MILTLEILSRSPLGPCNSSASDARNGRLRWFLLHFVQSLLPRRYRHSADAVLPARYQHVFLVDVCPAIRSKLRSVCIWQRIGKPWCNRILCNIGDYNLLEFGLASSSIFNLIHGCYISTRIAFYVQPVPLGWARPPCPAARPYLHKHICVHTILEVYTTAFFVKLLVLL
ncbi:uncharacterized protein LOC142766923 isoform X1 [Rhipicephalus microplus]|uniref:uncharacterized protein LOC142766923 isoform X1 n=1 Tax=Rhipicephalus microplus TaxID=6941 RepID=UPI003F6D4EC9